MTTPSELAEKLRAAFPDYAPTAASAEDAAYLDTLGLPPEIDAFFRTQAPAKPIGASSQLMSVGSMRSEHEDCEPGITIRAAGSSVLVTANGNPYFVVRKDDGYEIRLVSHEDVSEDDTLDDLVELSAPGLVFTSFAELIDALCAQILPSSPYAEQKVDDFNAWRARR